jgi:hypothetical protein
MFLQHLCVDHDHRSGHVRGLLCNARNTAIGLFEEDTRRFEAALAYLSESRKKQRSRPSFSTTAVNQADSAGSSRSHAVG